MYVRVRIDYYDEGEVDSVEAATQSFLEWLREEADETHLTVEVFNEETQKWE